MCGESNGSYCNWNFDPEDITDAMQEYPVIDIEYSENWSKWDGEPRFLRHNWDDSNPIPWEELIVYDLNNDLCPPIPLGQLITERFYAVWYYAELHGAEGEVCFSGWDDHFYAAPGEEPTMHSPEVPIDWSGFLEALVRGLADEMDFDEERVEKTINSLLADGLRAVDLIRALHDQ